MSERNCWNCKHSVWQETANGRRNPRKNGTCEHPVSASVDNGTYKDTLPYAVARLGGIYRSVIWRTSGEACPTWEEREK